TYGQSFGLICAKEKTVRGITCFATRTGQWQLAHLRRHLPSSHGVNRDWRGFSGGVEDDLGLQSLLRRAHKRSLASLRPERRPLARAPVRPTGAANQLRAATACRSRSGTPAARILPRDAAG